MYKTNSVAHAMDRKGGKERQSKESALLGPLNAPKHEEREGEEEKYPNKLITM